MYPLFESLCIQNGKILNSKWHEKRFRMAYLKYFGKSAYFNLLDEINIPKEFKKGIGPILGDINLDKIVNTDPIDFVQKLLPVDPARNRAASTGGGFGFVKEVGCGRASSFVQYAKSQ